MTQVTQVTRGKVIRFTLIGAGRIGRIHAGNIAAHPRARLAFVADADAQAAESLAQQFGARPVGLDTAVTASDVDAVLIASSTDTHADWIERCAAARKPVLCEKPLDLDAQRAAACVRVAREAGIALYLGFNRRYDPSFMRLKREIAAGTIGTLETLHIVSRDPAPPPVEYVKRSGGLFRDMMIHDLDMARWLLGAEPVEVFARGSAVDAAIGAAGDVDTAMVMLRTARGQLCQIANNRRCSFGYDQRIEAFGSQGMVRADNRTATSVAVAGASGFTTEPALPFFLERYADAYRLELHDFINALDEQRVELATGDDGWRALLLADAAQRSLTSGAPVAL
ncbi:MAG TPA: inositol 2-dehydrogenase [Steroidobacteraceae bacterium]|nr:inositol 2-dehydrogenase [Steroidobacteraceae bacterium]